MRSRSGPIAVLRHTTLDRGLAPYAAVVLVAFDGNPAFPGAGPLLAKVEAARAQLVDMETAPRGTYTGAELSAQRIALMQALRQLKEHVQGVIETKTSASDAMAMIESVQMRVRRYTKFNKPVLAAKGSGVSGGVELTAQAVRICVIYYWQYCVAGGSWVDLPETLKASARLTGLTVGQTYSFRFRTYTRAGMSDFSQVVTHLVG